MNSGLFLLGFLSGMLLALIAILLHLSRYVSSNVDSYFKWLEKGTEA